MTLSVRQTRIYVPPFTPFDTDTWVENLLGRVIAPLVQEQPELAWFWFSRYAQPPDGDCGDCDFSQIPDDFSHDGNLYRSLRFRYALPESDCDVFEERARSLIDVSGSKISDLRDFAWVDDLGGDRFLGEDRSDQRRERRADLVVKQLWATCAVMLDCLQGPDQDGLYRLEHNDSNENPHGSSFESIHHLVFNITNVPVFLNLRDASGGLHEIQVRF